MSRQNIWIPRATFGATAVLAVLLGACGSDPHPGTRDMPSDMPPDMPPSEPLTSSENTCLESPAPRGTARSLVTFNVVFTYGGKPVIFGEPFAVPTGTLTLTNLRFFASNFALLTAAGESVPVDLVGADGVPVSYNTQLVNPEDPTGMTFRVAAPAGEYAGASFIFGLNDACDFQNPSSSRPPLTQTSQLTWPQPFGFLFLRYAATLVRASGTTGDGPPTQIDMGGFPGALFAPRVQAVGGVQVDAVASNAVVMNMALDESFRASEMPIEPTPPPAFPPPPGITFQNGESLRQNASKVAIFSLTPAN